jgi:DNA-binding winged helix-turn-helix (wHTH) protein
MDTAGAALRFGRFELQVHERRLVAGGEPAALGARAFDLLLALAERPGRLLSKRVLMELVWPGLVVQDNNLAAQMSALRKVVGDEVITTIPGRGYRFVARVETAAAIEPPGALLAAAAAAPAAASPALPTHLPAELPALLGRADDLAALNALVDAQRLVTIVGPGGIGKSLLAEHLLQARRDAYAQGVCWVELASVLDGAALPGTIAAALGVLGGPGEPLAQLTHALSPLTMLLALDNAEHLLDAVAPLCSALHAACPRLRLVVTSQVPLKLALERVLRIEPLPVPAAALPADHAQRYGAVALFAERAQAIDARFVLTDANAPVVIALCRALDGLPLAIELAAARAPLLGVAPLLAALDERLKLLTTNRNREAPERQRTLRGARLEPRPAATRGAAGVQAPGRDGRQCVAGIDPASGGRCRRRRRARRLGRARCARRAGRSFAGIGAGRRGARRATALSAARITACLRARAARRSR